MANEKHLSFDGKTRIIHDCDGLDRNWMGFTASIDPEDVLIPVDTALFDESGDPMEIGLSLEVDPYGVYGTFLTSKRDESDRAVISSRGFLKFNKQAQKYEVAALDKLKQTSLPGNYVSLEKNSCDLVGLGQLFLGEDLGQFELNTLGELQYKPVDQRTNIEGSVAMDFFFNTKALELMYDYLMKVPDLKPVDFSKSNYEYAIREIMGLKESDKVISELSLSGTLKKVPEALNKTFLISDVKMTWDPVMESFISEGDIGIASIGEKQFFRKVPGKLVVEKKRSGDIIHLYIEVNDANWYYFTYKRGLLQAYSSDKDFNALLLEEKEEARKQAGDKKEDDYMYMLGSKSKQSIFADQFMF
jgi:hypothetical protein